MARRIRASIRSLTWAVVNPHHDEEAYNNFGITVVLKTSCNASAGMPCWRIVRNAKKHLLEDSIVYLQCSLKFSLESTVTPSILRDFTLFSPGVGGGSWAPFRQKINSDVFDRFNFKLCLAAHEAWWSSSADIVVELEDGTTKYASSAYLEYLFKGEMELRSDEFKLNRVGPRTEPWTIKQVGDLRKKCYEGCRRWTGGSISKLISETHMVW